MSSSGGGPGRTGLYQHSAALFDIRYAQKDYAAEAARFSTLVDRIHPGAATLLDVACGTGRHLQHLRSRYQAEGLDRSAELLRIARNHLIDVPLHEADMSGFNLGRSFDLVTSFFGSITYLGSTERMRQAISCMAKHLSPGGVLFIEPWLTPSVYREDEVVHNFRRTPEGAVSWMYVHRRRGSVAVWDIHWLVGTPEEGVTHFVETEELSLFTAEECTAALRDAGLDVVHHDRGLHGYGAYFGRVKGWSADEVAGINDALAG
jgi:SAM-dependent methyltransferase